MSHVLVSSLLTTLCAALATFSLVIVMIHELKSKETLVIIMIHELKSKERSYKKVLRKN